MENETYIKRNGDFLMRELTEADLEQFNDLLRYAFQVTTDELVKSGWEDDEIKYAKTPVLKSAYVLGWFYKGTLASMVVVYPMRVNIYDEIYEMGGITGVATYPEYAGRGLIHSLMKHALRHMRENGQSISFLYPYSIPFYRKQGWEIASDKITYTIKDTQLPKMRPVAGMVKRVDLDDEDLRNVHQYFTMQRHGALIRGQLEWEEYWRWDNEDMVAAVYYNDKNKPLGYVVYYIENEIFYIKELVYLNNEANYGLWNYISAHFSMIEQVKGFNYTGEPMAFLFEDSEIVETIEPYIMARIVDVREFLMRYPFQMLQKDFRLHFKVEDPVVPWNNGNFLVYWEDEEVVCERVEENDSVNVVELNIQTLTTMLMGYKRPTFLYNHARLKTEYYMVHLLERLIPVEKPYFSDYF